MDDIADRIHRVTLVADTSQFKKGMGDAADSVKKVAGASEETSAKSSGAFDNLGKKLGGVLTGAAIIGGAKAILDLGLSYDQSLNSMQAVTGATGDEMARVSELAKQLGNDINIPGASASDAAEAMTELAKGGLTLSESMGAAKGTLQLATAAQISGAEAATIQADALNSFGLEASSASHVADLLANAANSATGDIGDFGAGLSQASATAASMGVSVDDTVTMLGLFANAGIKGSDAGTSLRTMLQMLQAPTEKASTAMEELGLTVYDSQGNFVGMRSITEDLSAAQASMSQEAFNAATNLVFGADASRGASIAAAGGVTAYDDMATSLGKVGGASQLAAAQAQGLPGALANIQNQAENVALSLYESISPALEEILNSAADVLPAVGDFFGGVVSAAGGFIGFVNDLPGPVKLAATAMTAIALVKSPVSDAFEKITDKISDFKAKVEEAAGATSPLVASVTPLADAMGVGGDQAGLLAEGLAGAAEKAKEAKTATDDVKGGVDPMAAAMDAAGVASGALVTGLEGAAGQADSTATAAGGVNDAVDPLSGALEGAGLSADALGEGLGAASEKAKETKGSAEGGAGGLKKLGAAGRIAGAGLMSAFGGPIGLAITGVTFAIGLVSDAFAAVEPVATDLSSAIDAQTGAWNENAAAAISADLAQSGLLTKLSAVGLAEGEATAAIIKGGPELDAVTKKIQDYASAAESAASAGDYYNNEGILVKGTSDELDNATGLLRDWNATIGAVTETQATGQQTATDYNAAVEDAAAAADAAGTSTAALTPLQEAMNKAWEDGAIDSGELKSQVDAVMLAMDQMAGRNGDAEAAQRAFNAQSRDYTKAIIDQTQEAQGLAQAEADLAQAQADRTEVQNKATSETYSAEQKQRDLEQADRDVSTATADLAKTLTDQGAAADASAAKAADLQRAMADQAVAASNNALVAGDLAGAYDAAKASVQGSIDKFIAMQSPADIASGKAKELATELFGIPSETAAAIIVSTSGDVEAEQKLKDLERDRFVNLYLTPQGFASVANGIRHADGGIVEAAANGLMRQPMIVKGGANGKGILWGEPETGWEAYISGKPSMLQRNRGILAEAADRLNMVVMPKATGAVTAFADGGLTSGVQRSLGFGSVTNNSRGGNTYHVVVQNSGRRAITGDEISRALREAERTQP